MANFTAEKCLIWKILILPFSNMSAPRAVALASSTYVNKTTKIITEFTRKDPFFTSETSELSILQKVSYMK